MKKMTVAVLSMVFAMGMPMAAMAMKHMDHAEHGKTMAEEKMQHGDMKHADEGMHKGNDMKKEHAKEMSHDMHKGHNMSDDDDFVEIGKDTQKGVVATVQVKTYDEKAKATMAKSGVDATHHVMIFFVDEKSGDAVVGGKAAIKVKGQGGKPAMLMQMGEGYGADVKLEGMMNTFEIGTKLEDGKKRQFLVTFHNM